MAKDKKATTTAEAVENGDEKKKSAFTRKDNQQIRLLREPNEGEKIAPQMGGILKCLKEVGGKNKTLTRKVLLDRMPEFSNSPKSQAASRIFQFYRKRLVEDGFLEIIDPEPEEKAA